ncbi:MULTISPECIES: Lrp/AsnC family transcriptional regulator [Tatumella]|uniref:Lrp/AsnC family transcriptional regulator n=1 Tax=Tatumella punctata TaxID=399969 RepID=A0ABW1VS96_9GAMM|nr:MULTISPECIES: Lrp/AsnC family transcriptional regulator [unclassified Tatumella]MBS0856066.1 Lrp/AsnC family transcriptional regulator [Tatumella sp. JGM16]MBS0878125.1 Lrp/AsnC family transcriptional regulator [Tatumella sp. JGM82]MBS0890484.1 Lrp/AsnC family transcriptional regulator [Tatumella sp. JGM94]MBS0895175.1 Lrp/AsnC family transcriptional regulator [Tatumella sp. JGM130]MBS0900940.1 Lrp/AsnC family transcriptional regulator [Tatumella sp. JGM100]
MKDTDKHLVALLRENARASVTELAATMKVSRATVQKRMEALENEGVITGYTVKVKPGVEQNKIRAWMNVAVEGTKAKTVLQQLRGDPAVYTLHTTNGKWDLLVELRSDSLENFDRILGRVRRIEGIQNTETSILLSTHKA